MVIIIFEYILSLTTKQVFRFVKTNFTNTIAIIIKGKNNQTWLSIKMNNYNPSNMCHDIVSANPASALWLQHLAKNRMQECIWLLTVQSVLLPRIQGSILEEYRPMSLAPDDHNDLDQTVVSSSLLFNSYYTLIKSIVATNTWLLNDRLVI